MSFFLPPILETFVMSEMNFLLVCLFAFFFGFLGVFNDIAVASAVALRDYPHKCNKKTPILVIDLDVHQV